LTNEAITKLFFRLYKVVPQFLHYQSKTTLKIPKEKFMILPTGQMMQGHVSKTEY